MGAFGIGAEFALLVVASDNKNVDSVRKVAFRTESTQVADEWVRAIRCVASNEPIDGLFFVCSFVCLFVCFWSFTYVLILLFLFFGFYRTVHALVRAAWLSRETKNAACLCVGESVWRTQKGARND